MSNYQATCKLMSEVGSGKVIIQTEKTSYSCAVTETSMTASVEEFSTVRLVIIPLDSKEKENFGTLGSTSNLKLQITPDEVRLQKTLTLKITNLFSSFCISEKDLACFDDDTLYRFLAKEFTKLLAKGIEDELKRASFE